MLQSERTDEKARNKYKIFTNHIAQHCFNSSGTKFNSFKNLNKEVF